MFSSENYASALHSKCIESGIPLTKQDLTVSLSRKTSLKLVVLGAHIIFDPSTTYSRILQGAYILSPFKIQPCLASPITEGEEVESTFIIGGQEQGSPIDNQLINQNKSQNILKKGLTRYLGLFKTKKGTIIGLLIPATCVGAGYFLCPILKDPLKKTGQFVVGLLFSSRNSESRDLAETTEEKDVDPGVTGAVGEEVGQGVTGAVGEDVGQGVTGAVGEEVGQGVTSEITSEVKKGVPYRLVGLPEQHVLLTPHDFCTNISQKAQALREDLAQGIDTNRWLNNPKIIDRMLANPDTQQFSRALERMRTSFEQMDNYLRNEAIPGLDIFIQNIKNLQEWLG